MDKEEYYRRLSRVEDRDEKCVVNPQFSHFCQKHKQPVCARKNPPHCAWKGKLEVVELPAVINDSGPPKRTYKLHLRNKYCEECVGQSQEALKAFKSMNFVGSGSLDIRKMSPGEIQELRERPSNVQ